MSAPGPPGPVGYDAAHDPGGVYVTPYRTPFARTLRRILLVAGAILVIVLLIL